MTAPVMACTATGVCPCHSRAHGPQSCRQGCCVCCSPPTAPTREPDAGTPFTSVSELHAAAIRGDYWQVMRYAAQTSGARLQDHLNSECMVCMALREAALDKAAHEDHVHDVASDALPDWERELLEPGRPAEEDVRRSERHRLADLLDEHRMVVAGFVEDKWKLYDLIVYLLRLDHP